MGETNGNALFETVRQVPELAAVFDYVTGPGEVGQAVIKPVLLMENDA